jgi:hypothetical protein
VWQWDEWMERGSAVILIGGKLRIGAQPAVAGGGSGWQCGCAWQLAP